MKLTDRLTLVALLASISAAQAQGATTLTIVGGGWIDFTITTTSVDPGSRIDTNIIFLPIDPSSPSNPGSAPEGPRVIIGGPRGVALGADGAVYYADPYRHIVRRYRRSTGELITLAGQRNPGFTGDGGPASRATLNAPIGIAVDSAGNVFISDTVNNRIRRIDATTGVITTVAGTGAQGYNGDGGPGVRASLFLPQGLAVDPSGNLYIADSENHVIRRLTPSGIITTVAGNGSAGFGGDGGLATEARLNSPRGIALDKDGNILIADTNNHRIRRVRNGQIDTLAGNGVAGYAGEGVPAVQSQLNAPHGVAADGQGQIYISDSSNNRIRTVALSGLIRTFLGNGFPGAGGDQLWFPYGLSVDAEGALIFADSMNDGIRVTVDPARAPRLNPSLQNVNFVHSVGSAPPAEQAITFASTSTAIRFTVRNPSANWLTVNAREAVTPATVKIGVNPLGLSPGTYSTFLEVETEQTLEGTTRIPVSFTVNNPTSTVISALPATLSFTAAAGGLAPAAQTINVTSNAALSGVSVSAATTTGGNWLAASAESGSTPLTVRVTVSPSALPAGTYEGVVRITALNAGNSPVTLRVSLRVEAAATLTVAPQSLTFRQSGTEVLTIAANRSSLAYSASVELPAGQNWLAISPTRGTTPGAVSVTADVAGLFPGEYLASVAISDTNVTTRVPVRLIVQPRQSTLVFDPLPVDFRLTSAATATTRILRARSSNELPVSFRVGAAISPTATRNWLSVRAAQNVTPAEIEVIADPTGLSPGVHVGSINFEMNVAGVPNGLTSIEVVLTVVESVAPTLRPDNPQLTFTSNQDENDQQLLVITNPSDASARYDVVVAAPWLGVASSSGAADVSHPGKVALVAKSAGLAPGVYESSVLIKPDGGDPFNIKATLLVSSRPRLELSAQRLLFVLNESDTMQQSQEIQIVNRNSTSVPWNATLRTIAGGDWLRISRISGNTGSLAERTMNVTINPRGLRAGIYRGEILVYSAEADNSPATVAVQLDVRPRDEQLGPLLSTAGVVFTAIAGQPAPEPQDLIIQNRDAAAITFNAEFVLEDPSQRRFITVEPSRGRLGSWADTSDPLQRSIAIRPDVTGLPAGFYRGTLTIVFPGGVVRQVNVLLVIAPATTSTAEAKDRAAGGCTPRSLLPLFTSSEDRVTIASGDAVRSQLAVVDDCGGLATGLAIAGRFSNGDPAVQLHNLGAGRYQTSWQVQRQAASVRFEVGAVDPNTQVQGDQVTRVTLAGASDEPVVFRGGLRDAQNPGEPAAAFAPGSRVLIQGARLAETSTVAPGPVYPRLLGGVSVTLGDLPIPLVSVDQGEIVAQLPLDLPVNTIQELIVRRGGLQSLPSPVILGLANKQ